MNHRYHQLETAELCVSRLIGESFAEERNEQEKRGEQPTIRKELKSRKEELDKRTNRQRACEQS